VRNRIGIHVTRGGALFFLALLLTGLGAFVSANNLLFLVFSSMLALLLVSGFLSRLVLAGLELELLLPEHVSARTPAPARVRLRNLKRLTPSFSIELAGREDPLSRTPSILGTALYFPLIPGHSSMEADVQVTFPWRGRHHDNLFSLSTRFPFGFLRKTARVTLHRETVVYPSIEPNEQAEALLDAVTDEVETHFRGAGLDFYRIRPYETTDSARLVDWKSTAHTGDLQVREFSREEDRAVEIYLDRRIPNHGDWFEEAVQSCAFLAWHLAEREIGLTVRSQGNSGISDVYDVLRFLALVQPITGTAKESDPVELPADPSGVQIVFTRYPGAFETAGWSSMS
jgi:uncharacterized protein (DUF58 family)